MFQKDGYHSMMNNSVRIYYCLETLNLTRMLIGVIRFFHDFLNDLMISFDKWNYCMPFCNV